MNNSAKNIINKYGSLFKMERNDSMVTVRGIIQPLYHKDRNRGIFSRIPLGFFDKRHQFVIFPNSVVFEKNKTEFIYCGDVKYKVNSFGTYSVKDKPVYVWAVISACTDSLEDDYENDN